MASVVLVRGGDALRPAQADSFVDSVGLCVHLQSPPYLEQFERVLAAARGLGVRHFRDDFRPDDNVGAWSRLFRECGVRRHMLLSPLAGTVDDALDFVKAVGIAAVSAVEGQNEGDSEWFRSQLAAGSDWAEVVIAHQRSLFDAIRSHRPAETLPIVSPTVLDYKPDDMLLLRPAAAFCDLVGLHAYVQRGEEPETTDEYSSLLWYLCHIRDPFKSRAPAMVTEAGYATSTGSVSSSAAGKYLPRLLLQNFADGIVRTFLYEMMDEGADPDDPEQNYGILTARGEPKPVFEALQRLLQTLADSGPIFDPAPLELQISPLHPLVRISVFGQRDGRVVLAVWLAARSWDPVSKRDLSIPPVDVAVRAPSFNRAEALRLERESIWEVAPRRGGGWTIPIDDTVTLIRLCG